MPEDAFFKRIAEVDDGPSPPMGERRAGTASLRVARSSAVERAGVSAGQGANDDVIEATGTSPAVEQPSEAGGRLPHSASTERVLRAVAVLLAALGLVGAGMLAAAVTGGGSESTVRTLTESAALDVRPLPALADGPPRSGKVMSPKRKRRLLKARSQRHRAAEETDASPPAAQGTVASGPPIGGTREGFDFERGGP